MNYVRLAIAIINFIVQFLKWMNKDESGGNIKVKVKKFSDFANALQKAETNNDGADLEKLFTVIRPKK